MSKLGSIGGSYRIRVLLFRRLVGTRLVLLGWPWMRF